MIIITHINHSKNNEVQCMYIKTQIIYSLTFLLLGIDDLFIFLNALISFHAKGFTDDLTPMSLVEDNWRFHFTELVCKHGLQISHSFCT